MDKYYLYARVSSKEQEREGYSIPAQLKAIKEYVNKNDLIIAQEFTDAETAKTSGRTSFTLMISELKKNSEIKGILCEKVDRLTRNFPDYVELDKLVNDHNKELHLVKQNLVITKDSKSSEKLIFDIHVALARNYINNLSDEVKKGMQEKVAQGGYPHWAPIGYLNSNSKIIPDPDKHFYIRKIFELYADGLSSVRDIAKQMYDEGLRTKYGKRVYPSEIHFILKNPFYTGVTPYKGQIYPGKHEPIIETQLFNKVQSLLCNNPKEKGTKYKFPLRGFFTCGECGCKITAEIQRGHTYYRCTKSKGNCSQKYVREEALTEQISDILDDLKLDPELIDVMLKVAKETKNEECRYHTEVVDSLQKQLKQTEAKINKLLDVYLEGKVPEDLYNSKKQELEDHKRSLELKIAQNNRAHGETFEQIEKVVKVANACNDLFLTGDYETKRKLLTMISSNMILKDRKIASYQLKKPFNILLNAPKIVETANKWAQ